MAKNKHLTLDERTTLSELLNQSHTFSSIAAELEKSPSTISREIRGHVFKKKVGAPGRCFNDCIHRFSCDKSFLCSSCGYRRFRSHCRQCKMCCFVCDGYEKENCTLLLKPPYVCNGCLRRKSCTLEKSEYRPVEAQQQYALSLSESRSGISLTEQEVAHLDSLVSGLLFKGQSLHHICVNHPDSIMVSESTLYRLLDYNLFKARNIDMPRKIRFSRRKLKKHYKVDKGCRIGRNLSDFETFCTSNPDLPITQIDSVEGIKGGKVLLTIHFVKSECMLAFLRDSNDSQSVINIFDQLYLELRPDIFMSLIPILLGDNGSEFSNPSALEMDSQGNMRTHVFYCDASAPYQKGSAERNHEFIRYFVPKGQSFDSFSQKDISLMMDHINSYSRKSLGDKSPYDMMRFLYGQNVVDLLGMHKIPTDKVTLNNSVFAEEVSHD